MCSLFLNVARNLGLPIILKIKETDIKCIYIKDRNLEETDIKCIQIEVFQ